VFVTLQRTVLVVSNKNSAVIHLYIRRVRLPVGSLPQVLLLLRCCPPWSRAPNPPGGREGTSLHTSSAWPCCHAAPACSRTSMTSATRYSKIRRTTGHCHSLVRPLLQPAARWSCRQHYTRPGKSQLSLHTSSASPCCHAAPAITKHRGAQARMLRLINSGSCRNVSAHIIS
jgi:hypothetical protein